MNKRVTIYPTLMGKIPSIFSMINRLRTELTDKTSTLHHLKCIKAL